MSKSPDLQISCMQVNEIPYADAIISAAFEAPEDRRLEISRILEIQPDGFFIASLDGEPVGTVCGIDYGLFAYVGMMCISPEMQGQGIGRALLEHLLEWMERRACPLAMLDATPRGELLYRKLGFIECDRSRLFRRVESRSFKANANEVEFFKSAMIADVVSFDRPIFGADRTRIFETYLADYPRRAFVSRDVAGAIDGYLLARDRHIGPWVAVSSGVAGGLLAAALSLSFDGDVIVNVPGANTGAETLLLEAGFRLQRDLAHMRRGAASLKEARALVYGQTSFAVG
jgi:GNAT superfamily N-acetyltransferase